MKTLKFKTILVYFLVFIFTLTIYLWNTPSEYKKDSESAGYYRMITSSDAVPNTFLPYLLYKHQSFDFSPITFYFRQFDGGRKTQYFISKTDEGKFSSYPVFTGIAAFPVYAIPLFLNKIASFDFYENILKVLLLGRITAAFYSSISVLFMFHLLRKSGGSTFTQILFTVLFAFGTTMWSISSRSLWAHTMVVLFTCITLELLLYKKTTKKLYLLLGFVSGLLILTRSTTFVYLFFVGLYLLQRKKNYFPLFVLASIPPILFMFLYNYLTFGDFISAGYGARNDMQWTTPLLKGMISHITTPGKGFLFVTSPLMLIFPAIYKSFTDKKFGMERNNLYRYLSLGFLATFLMYSKWYSWFGGNSFGYRFFTDMLPVMVLLIYEYAKNLKPRILIILSIFILYSVVIQWNAVFFRKSRCKEADMYSFTCVTPHFLK